MIGLVMAGGRGTRMSAAAATGCEKLMLPIPSISGDTPVIMRVIGALRDSACVGDVVAAVSPNSPETRDCLLRHGVGTVQTPGLGYSRDLSGVLQSLDGPVLVASGDMPLLDGSVVDEVIAPLYDPDRGWTCVVTTAGFRGSLGMSPGVAVGACGDRRGGHYVYTGISLVNAGVIRGGFSHVEEHYVVVDDRRVAVDLNTPKDCRILGNV